MSSPEQRRGRVVLVRHGETEWSRQGRHTGLTDVPLTPEGEADARRLTGAFGAVDIGLVLASPLQRAARTAELAGLHPRTDPDLVEWDYGAYEGLTSAQVRGRRGPEWTVFSGGVAPGVTPGETLEQVGERAGRVLERIAPVLASADVVLIGHGHALRVLTARYLSRPLELAAQLVLEPATLSMLGHEHDLPAILSWNAGR